MIIKILLSFCFLILCSVKTNAQKGNCNPAVMLEVEKREPDPICFTRDTFPKNYRTKYIILLNDNEIYEVNFSYFKGKDSSSFLIFYIDKRANYCGTKKITFENGSSFFIIKNYSPNDTVVDYEDRSVSILFSVPDKDEPYVTLNRLLSIDDEKTIYKLTHIDQEVLKNHINATRYYLESKYRDSVTKAKYQLAVGNLKSEMVKYKTEKIDEIIRIENYRKTKIATTSAPDRLQQQFKDTLDMILIPYFKSNYPVDGFNLIGDFEFQCNGYGKIDSSIKLFSRTGENINWFKDSFNARVKPAILSGKYETPMEADDHPNLSIEFDNKFKERMYKLNPDGNEFAEILKQINTAFEDYRARKINVSARYSYAFKYRSEIRETAWRYSASDGTIKPINKNESIDDVLNALFKAKVSDSRSGRYSVRICNIFINDKDMGPNILQITKQ